MPVKWTPQLDQWLLLAIIDIKEVKLRGDDAQKIADTWPDGMGEQPTPRAISEHIVVLRKQLTKSGISTGGTSGPSTPSKKTSSNGANLNKVQSGRVSKRTPKKAKSNRADDDDEGEEIDDLVDYDELDRVKDEVFGDGDA